jgi:RNA polymerase sigma factor (sigma-70 family)
MTSPQPPENLFRPANAEQAALYESLGGYLQRALVELFQIPPDDAELLLTQTFNVYFHHMKEVGEARHWLIVAACLSAKRHLEKCGQSTGTEAAAAQSMESFVVHRDATATLTGTARTAIRMRFEERKSYPEIAAELGISPFAAEQLVKRAVQKLRGVIRGTR